MNEQPPSLIELRGERVVLRTLVASDASRIAELAAHPDVARWYPDATEDYLRRKAAGKPHQGFFAVVYEGETVGFIQYHEEVSPEYHSAGIDLFLGAPYHNRGLGTDTVRTLARHLIQDLEHHRLIIDPVAHNERAIRAYEKVGFRRVGIMRQYQRDPDGTWRDGLLLDLLATELT